MPFGPSDIEILEGLEAIRRRPTMYIGSPDRESASSRLLEVAVADILSTTPPPSAVRIYLWASNTLSIAFDGTPLPIEPSPHNPEIPHPTLYRWFMELTAPSINHLAL